MSETVGADRACAVISAIRSSWALPTSADPDRWTPDRPAIGQCDVSSRYHWDEFGGDPVSWAVFVGDEQTEHHWSKPHRRR